MAIQLAKEENSSESSMGSAGNHVWSLIWKLNVPNKIKFFGWRAIQEILPTRVNLEKRKIIQDNLCQCYEREPEIGVHALWECGATQDVWAGSITCLQKLQTSQCVMMVLLV